MNLRRASSVTHSSCLRLRLTDSSASSFSLSAFSPISFLMRVSISPNLVSSSSSDVLPVSKTTSKHLKQTTHSPQRGTSKLLPILIKQLIFLCLLFYGGL